MLCPDCQGRNGRTVYACPGFRAVHVPCETCAATGEVTQEQADLIQATRATGEALRAVRLERRESIRDAATRLGLDVVAYSRMEHGLAAEKAATG